MPCPDTLEGMSDPEEERPTRRRSLPPVFPDRTLIASGALGVLTGVLVYGFERSVTIILEVVRESPVVAMALAPAAGLVVTALVIRFGPEPRGRATADEYLEAMHREHRIELRTVVTRTLAAITTLGSGGSLGLEGPAVLLGAGSGDSMSRKLGRRLRVDHQAVLVAGAAAAVAAVFKAPATGAVFALEVPYRNDMARHRLMPALIGAAAGYLSLVTLAGTERLFPVADNPPFDLRDLGGALLLGLVAGLFARVIARSVRWAKHWAADTKAALRLPLATAALAVAAWTAFELTGSPLGIGPGYAVLDWIDDPRLGVGLLVAMLLVRFVGVVATTAGGGVGGHFIPLVVLGGLLGRLAAALTGSPSALFPVLGVAAVLGAGYGVPLAAVMFVAETSGRPAYVVPALIAAVAADLSVGSESVTDLQAARA